MKKHYLGVDAGGTHTRYMVFDSKGECIYKKTTGTIHFMQVGYDGMKDSLEMVKKELESYFPLESLNVAIGMAGYGSDPVVRDSIERSVWAVFPHAILMNDAKFAMISALNGEDGVYLISGTGSIAFRIYENTEDRRGGFGYLLGDEGSAYWIGRRLLELFTKEADGRLQKSDLYKCIMEHFDLNSPYEIIEHAKNAMHTRRNWVANISVLMSEVNNDKVIEVYRSAGLALAEMVNSFEIDDKTKIALGGGVLIHNKTVRDTLIENLRKEYHLVDNQYPVEYAAFLLHQSI